MNLVLTYDKYNINHIYYNDSIKNTVIDNSYFVKILYSNEDLTLSGIYLLVELLNISLDKYYNKYKCTIDLEKNKQVYQFLYKLENDILDKYSPSKQKKLIINNQLKQGNIKLFIENEEVRNKYDKARFILKISGIWEKNNEIGLTYKFILV